MLPHSGVLRAQPTRGPLAAAPRHVASGRRVGQLRARAAAPEDGEAARSSGGASPQLLQGAQQSVDRFLNRYEHSILSSAVGAGVVTTWCMAHGQEPGTAAAITCVATISALVLNELLFSDEGRSGSSS